MKRKPFVPAHKARRIERARVDVWDLVERMRPWVIVTPETIKAGARKYAELLAPMTAGREGE